MFEVKLEFPAIIWNDLICLLFLKHFLKYFNFFFTKMGFRRLPTKFNNNKNFVIKYG